MSGQLGIALASAAIFAPFGAATAAIITYTEYSRHHLGLGRVFRETARAAIIAGVTLFAAGALVGWLVSSG